MTAKDDRLVWTKVLDPEELAEGRVKPVTCHHRTVCMTRFNGKYGALDNRCPHQGGPLGEGSIENGLLRCPWHGWDFHPGSGDSPGGHDDGVEGVPPRQLRLARGQSAPRGVDQIGRASCRERT